MSKFARKVVEQAQKWLGLNEADGSHKQIIDIYNSHKPLARGYKVKYTDAWCSTFVSAVAIKLGYTDIIPTECGCGAHIELFKKIGAWVEDENTTPRAGDIIFYDWDDNGNGNNTGYPEHVGIVEKVTAKTITVIEGNKDNAVSRRKIAVNGKYIRGYGVPKYDAEGTPEADVTPSPQPSNTDPAQSFDEAIAGTYKVTASVLNVRSGAGTNKPILTSIPKHTKVQCYGYYTTVDGAKWLYVQFVQNGKKYTGFCCGWYLSK